MRILASILIVIGLLVTIGGVMGVSVGSKTGIIRLVVGLAIVGVAFAIRPKSEVPPGK